MSDQISTLTYTGTLSDAGVAVLREALAEVDYPPCTCPVCNSDVAGLAPCMREPRDG